MNKPAPKEPSMDEILSSIRQIIADDDAASTGNRYAVPPQPSAAPLRSAGLHEGPVGAQALELSPLRHPSAENDVDDDDAQEEAEPLALSQAQILAGDEAAATEAEPLAPAGDVAPAEVPEVSDAGDTEVSFALQSEPVAAPVEAAAPELSPEPRTQQQVASPKQATTNLTRTPVARSAPMPDPTLSRDIADKLIDTTADAAIRHTFGRLSELSIGTQSLTVEGMVRETLREMLRPMLTEWLDENLPTIVEQLVEKEIARISRGLD